ncbi:MAG: hypothetical protein KAR32_03265 [Candidatus Omnitrophica bacterium]|nr:hypothetical protein [Candidatus Omnitrophota bacterium]
MIKLAFCYLAIFLLAMLLIEGPVNIKRFFYSLSRPLAERVHTQYDALLGWAHIPDFYAENMYGPGVYLRTNAQSLRSNKNFSASIPHDRLRVIIPSRAINISPGRSTKSYLPMSRSISYRTLKRTRKDGLI